MQQGQEVKNKTAEQMKPKTLSYKNRGKKESEVQYIKVPGNQKMSTEVYDSNHQSQILSEKMLHSKMEAGHAFGGTLLTGHFIDKIRNRKQVLFKPKTLNKSWENKQKEDIMSFFTEQEVSNYEQAIEHGMISAARIPNEENIPINTAGENAELFATSELQICTIKCCSMHIARTSLDIKDLVFSIEAMDELNVIMKMYAAGNDVLNECIKFFSDYGSHFILGPFSFGGHFLWKCYSKGSHKNQANDIMNMQEEIISSNIETTFPGLGVTSEVNIDKYKMSFSSKCSKDVIDSTILEVKIFGGPYEAKNMSQWKDGLQRNSSTCMLIDRGNSLIPVWDIIKLKYEAELGEIGVVLKSSWKTMTGHKHESLENQQLQDCKFCSFYEASCISMISTCAAAHDILHKLKLCQHYYKKLTLQSALHIGLKDLELSLDKTTLSGLEQLPNLILHKLISYDSLCRSDLLPEDLAEDNSSDQSSSSDESIEDDTSISDDDTSDISDSKQHNNKNRYEIHPVDALLAVLLCSDAFLLQDLFSRLAKCQLALPFVFPDPFAECLTLPLWALRSIIKEWNIVKEKEIYEQIEFVIKYPMHIVSFIRFGKHQKYCPSKSKIINQVINDNDDGHNFFFHRDCHGGEYKYVISEGLVDMTWYLPSERNGKDGFSDALTFLNLHGDAKLHMSQSQFLAEISSICFIMLAEKISDLSHQERAILKGLKSSTGDITFLNGTENRQKILKKEYPKASFINLIEENASSVKKKIRKRIRNKVQNMTHSKSIEEWCSVGKNYNIIIDESNEEYRQGHLHAEKVFSVIKDKSKCLIKDEILPLQGECLWKTWASHDKELHRVTKKKDKSVNEYVEDVEEKKREIRALQRREIEKMTQATVSKLFMDCLLEHMGPSKSVQRTYFVHCLQLELNILSSKVVFEKQNQYKSARKRLSQLEAKTSICHDTEVSIEIYQINLKLKHLQKNITESAIGLEHLLREVGQFYEASLKHGYCDQLPKAAAELLIDGFPLELMDGDAAHVPLQWVTAVLNEVVKLLNDPKIFVFSVLGLQSTGKSTLLNTTFGLQFNVSKGRCTCGAFMQLLPIDEELKTSTGCSYILVVDTEGLRAPELDPLKTQRHDNELATFVIGLANITLINIYGSVTGDMDDILQTSVHAFLRMSEVNYYPSCKFVHQNAGPSVKEEFGHARLTQKLDQFSAAAAKVEAMCKREVECFNDVIYFNDQTDIHYFPALLKGDPPMAPINQGYSHAAQILKYELVQNVCGKIGISTCAYLERSLTALSFSSFKVKLQDLWTSLLKENFVFGFKNTLEIAAYNALEREYSHWDWTFQDAMIKWEQIAENEIITAPIDSVEDKVKLKLEELNEYVREEYAKVNSKMKEFFNGKASDVAAQWRDEFETKFDFFKSELEYRASEQCRLLKENRIAASRFEEEREKYIKYMKEQIQNHIESKKMEQIKLQTSIKSANLEPKQLQYLLERNLFTEVKMKMYEERKALTLAIIREIRTILKKEKTEEKIKRILILLDESQVNKILTEDGLEEKFDEIWSSIHDQKPPQTSLKLTSVKNDVEKALMKYAGSKAASYLIKRLSKKDLKECGDLDDEQKGNTLASVSENNTSIIKTCVEKASEHLDIIRQKEPNFHPAYVHKILRLVDEEISANQDTRIITPDGKCHIYLTICGYALPIFEGMARAYEEKLVKGPLFVIFKNQYRQTEAEIAIADSLCTCLKEPIKQQVETKISTRMPNDMRASCKHFSNKLALKVKVLTDLFHRNDFYAYRDYLVDTSAYLEKSLKKYSIQYCDEEMPPDGVTRLQSAAIHEMCQLIKLIEYEIDKIKEPNIYDWLEKFCDNVKSVLGTHLNFTNLLYMDESIQELKRDDLKFNIRRGLKILNKELQSMFRKISYEDFNWSDQHPYKALGTVVGCKATCPFCGEQCDLLEGHEKTRPHRTEVHRLDGLHKWVLTDRSLSLQFCPALMNSGDIFKTKDGEYIPYKEYRSIYKDWSITPDVTSETCLYWKWFMTQYDQCIASEYKARLPEKIPQRWHSITWKQIAQNLKKMYNLEEFAIL